MASGDGSEPKLSGFSKYYNSVTPQGRANVSNLKISFLTLMALSCFLNTLSSVTRFNIICMNRLFYRLLLQQLLLWLLRVYTSSSNRNRKSLPKSNSMKKSDRYHYVIRSSV